MYESSYNITMTSIRKLIPGILIPIIITMFFSCGLDDFKLKELANPIDIIPEYYAPLAYGTFKIKDMITANISDATPIPVVGIYLDPFVMGKTNVTFSSVAIDSVYLINHFTNNTPVNMDFSYYFYDSSTGFTIGKTFLSGTIRPGVQDTLIQFNLGRADQNIILQSSDIIMRFKMSNPGVNPLLYSNVKNATFSIKIAFYSPVMLWKLK